jgi:DNA-binding transcriptional LysR family regulator
MLIKYSAEQLAARLDLHTLHIFLTVVEAGSLSEAAAREHLVVSAVSRRMTELERVAGASLFERRHDGITPTAAGLEMASHVRELRRVLERVEEGLGAHRAGLRGEVRLHACTSALLDDLPSALTHYIAAHPDVDVNVRELDSAQVVRGVRDGHAHVGISSSYVCTEGLLAFPFRSDSLAAVVPAGHALARCKSVRFKETLPYEHVALQDGEAFSALLAHMQGVAGECATSMRIRIKVRTSGAACRFVDAGLGVAVLRESSARLYAAGLNLVMVPLREKWSSLRHDICVRDLDTLPAAARQLVEELRATTNTNTPT